jgi:hypothetical protein
MANILFPAAILLLEKDSIRRDKALYTVLEQKKLMGVKVLEHRLQLAKLYKCIGHHDVVNNIIKDWTLPAISEHLRRGYAAEIEADWTKASSAYEEGHDVEVDDAQEYCLEGMFRVRLSIGCIYRHLKATNCIFKHFRFHRY